MFDFHPPELSYRLLTHSYMDLVAAGPWTNPGLVLCTDGTEIPAPRPQLSARSAREAAEIEGHQDGSNFSAMKGKGMRGRRGIFLSDGLIDPLAAVAAVVQPAAPLEFPALGGLVESYVENARRHPFWDRICMPMFVVADAGFARRVLAADLLYRWGIILVTRWSESYTAETARFGDNRGVPYHWHGPPGKKVRCDAALISVSNWPHASRRAAQFPQLRLGDDIRPHLGSGGARRPLLHYSCPYCSEPWDLDIREAEHIYSPLPFKAVQ